MYANKLGYSQVDQTGAASLVKSGPAGFFGAVAVSGTAFSLTVYDNTAASGTVLFHRVSVTEGDTIDFGGLGYAAHAGLFVVVGGTGQVNVLYT